MDSAFDASRIALRDLEDHEKVLGAFKGKTVILIGGGYPAIEEAADWAEALDEEYAGDDDVQVVGAAIIGDVLPGVSKDQVKSRLKDFGTVPVLVDWEGQSSEAFDLDGASKPHVFVIDRDGVLRFRTVGDLSDAALAKVKGEVEAVE
ncbi:MAG TPA: redoxin family protein [Bacillota bacterium]|jgi:predicted transcriptional regulator